MTKGNRSFTLSNNHVSENSYAKKYTNRRLSPGSSDREPTTTELNPPTPVESNPRTVSTTTHTEAQSNALTTCVPTSPVATEPYPTRGRGRKGIVPDGKVQFSSNKTITGVTKDGFETSPVQFISQLSHSPQQINSDQISRAISSTQEPLLDFESRLLPIEIRVFHQLSFAKEPKCFQRESEKQKLKRLSANICQDGHSVKLPFNYLTNSNHQEETKVMLLSTPSYIFNNNHALFNKEDLTFHNVNSTLLMKTIAVAKLKEVLHNMEFFIKDQLIESSVKKVRPYCVGSISPGIFNDTKMSVIIHHYKCTLLDPNGERSFKYPKLITNDWWFRDTLKSGVAARFVVESISFKINSLFNTVTVEFEYGKYAISTNILYMDPSDYIFESQAIQKIDLLQKKYFYCFMFQLTEADEKGIVLVYYGQPNCIACDLVKEYMRTLPIIVDCMWANDVAIYPFVKVFNAVQKCMGYFTSSGTNMIDLIKKYYEPAEYSYREKTQAWAFFRSKVKNVKQLLLSHHKVLMLIWTID
ncbi:hypothetical protein PPL_09740 [Heterostelium album PN500]|uniref:Uncharacterized protein n=1 Tax=Heterostelium pallidum (strain ATCC 26659 / Pp 5 / PN500) TaxID=670386 RepID=D3BNN7_HETP5|nr:hypothetical protein PPL_09740 [Heterostelium album PN500]EFA76988.1 hypothetical protein PPL_09740 [Heterostelium album PN500]|eukprot:XP_020429119.1 hypothetical protein PPL_09740 [Heterostelium album PN500]